MDHSKQSSFEEISEFLASACTNVTELDPKQSRKIWQNWKAAFPLRPKRPHAILDKTLFNRISWATGSLNGRLGIAKYESADATGLHVLLCDHLGGWTCVLEKMPDLDSVNANLIVIPLDYSWTLCVQEWGPPSLLDRYVFLEPKLDGSCVDGHLPS